jgi:hypothetical protein
MPDTHPSALRCCQWCYRGFDVCWSGARRSIILAFLAVPVSWIVRSLVPTVDICRAVFSFFILFAGLFSAGYVILLVIRTIILTFFFAKYSLGQLMTVLLLAGLGVSLLVELEDFWLVLPGLGLALLFWIVIVYLDSYDPFNRNKVLPRAAREMLFNPPDAPKPQIHPNLPTEDQPPA